MAAPDVDVGRQFMRTVDAATGAIPQGVRVLIHWRRTVIESIGAIIHGMRTASNDMAVTSSGGATGS